MHADQISCMNLSRTTQLTLILGGLFGEDVALKRHRAFYGAATAWLEPLGGATLGFHLWHVLPFDYFAAAGGGTFPRFEPEVDLFAQFLLPEPCPPDNQCFFLGPTIITI